MKNKVSVIIPTYNSQRTIKNCLQSIVDQSYKNIEIIVVDNYSTDKTSKIAQKYTKNFYFHGRERSAQRNFGANKATGDYLLFIDSDMILGKNVVAESIQVFSDRLVKMVVIPEESFGESFWAHCKALERSFYLGIEHMEASRFFSKNVFVEFSGYDEHNTGTEDYDLPQRISAKYGKQAQARIEEYILHDEGALSLLKTLQKKFYYAQKLSVYSSKSENKAHFSQQSSILQRYSLFFSDYKKLLGNPLLAIGMLTMKTLEFIFGGMGYVKSFVNILLNKVVRFFEIDFLYIITARSKFMALIFVFYSNLYTIFNCSGMKIRSFYCNNAMYYFDTLFCMKTFFASSYDFFSITEQVSIFNTTRPVIVDIGANVGQFLFGVKSYLPESTVISFEPDPKIFAILKKNAKKYASVKTIACALGDKNTHIQFYRNLDFSEWSSLLKGVNGENYETITIIQKTADDILKSISHIDMIKIDVEGMELSVLKGMKKTLNKTDFVLIEMSINRNTKDLKETFLFLLEHNFVPYHYGRIFSSGKFEKQGAIDILFKKN